MDRRAFLKSSMAVGSVASLSTANEAPLSASAQPPGPAAGAAAARFARDVALMNAKVVTLNPQQPSAEAVLVRNGRIAQLGTNRDVKAAAGQARVIDLGGKAVVPGFIDAHTHFELNCNAVAYQVMCQSPPRTSLKEIFELLRAKAAVTSPGRWVVGRGSFGFEDVVAEKRLARRTDLDAISDTIPIVLLSGLHVAQMNTAAMKALGLWDKGSEANLKWPGGTPVRGTAFHRDQDGVPIGIGTELQFVLVPAWNYSVEETQAAIKAHAGPLFIEKGITSLATLPFFVNELRASQQLQERGELPMRLRVYYRVPLQLSIEGFFGVGYSSGMGNDMFRYGGLKMYVDGNGDDGLGKRMEDFKWSQEDLNRMVKRAQDAGIQSIMHVVTPGGLEMAMDAVEAAQRGTTAKLRHRVEHVGFLRDPATIRRMRQLGMRLTITRATPFTRGRGSSQFATLIREGLEPMAVSDATGTTPGFSPLGGIASLLSPPADRGSDGDNAISVEDALRTWTLWAARGQHEEQDKGSVEVGKLGDFAVLSADPRAVSPEEMSAVRVDATVLGGEVVFERS
jgi:predicted amidohydrolase YtcJ